MAALQKRAQSWRVLFRYQGQQHSLWIGEVRDQEAHAVAARVDYWLMRFKQKLVHLPPGCDIVTFLKYDGKPPEHPTAPEGDLTLVSLFELYLCSQERKLEPTTLDSIQLHSKHLLRILGAGFSVPNMKRADLQRYADQRAKEWIDPNVFRRQRRQKLSALPPRKNRKKVPPPITEDKPRRHPSPATVKKEIISLRTAWNWGRRQLSLKPEFPGNSLDYGKLEESLPFMTWEEAEHRIAAGDSPDRVWDCLYLRPNEVAELLEWVKAKQPISSWVYPLFCFAAYTGARRSEICRAAQADLDLAGGVVTIHEKKRVKKKNTTRRVPLTPFLQELLADWIAKNGKSRTLFSKNNGKSISPREVHNYFQRALRGSKWAVLRGLHIFRHSFISALASRGIDQRIIDDFVGHQTDEQRRRYRHLHPSVKQEAMKLVFG